MQYPRSLILVSPLLFLGVACGPDDGSADAADTGVSKDSSDTNQTRDVDETNDTDDENDGDGSTDTGESDDGTDTRDTGDDEPTDTGPTEGIPDEITTSGARFVASLEGGESATIDLAAQEGDVVVIRMIPDGSWEPGLYIYRPGDNGREQLAYSEPSAGETAHLPFEDSNLQDGWEFYQGGRHVLELTNRSSQTGDFEFQLECVGGPCGDSSGGGGEDDIPASEDNCPDTANPDQKNTDGDLYGDACDPEVGTINCPSSLSGEALEQRIRTVHESHQTLTYDEAREALFENVDNENGELVGLYTGRTITTPPNWGGVYDKNFSPEHIWPQSYMEAEEPPYQSDLHSLFATDNDANLERNNHPFDLVPDGNAQWSEGGSKQGDNSDGLTAFEPRDSAKGAVARAVFYFDVVYDGGADTCPDANGGGVEICEQQNAEFGDGRGIGDEEELRRWHNSIDPPTEQDRARNDAVYEVQNSRNPFVDCPALVDKISDF